MKPKVSILTPTRNRRRFIPQYLKFLRKQLYPSFLIEILVADDGEDNVSDLFDGSIRYFRLPERKPLGYKRNLLSREARGDILIHMDDDDYYPPTRITHAVETLEGTEAMLAGCSKIYIYFSSVNKMYVSGPFMENHGVDGTFAYRREYLKERSFDDSAMIQLEARFTKNFTVPMVQLNTERTILVIQHKDNTFNKSLTTMKTADKRLKDFVPDLADRRFYRKLRDMDQM